MTVAQKLEKTSGIFFFLGFLLSKLQYLPFPLVSTIFKFLSLGIYSLAYGSWSIACLLHPDHKEHHQKWYGFAQIKEQFFFSSFLGLIATGLSIAAVFVPVLFPAAAWLFLVGNVLWTIGEYHKLKNPPQDNEDFSYTQQKNYLYYAITSCVISLVSAVSATLVVAFPPFLIPITIFSLLLYTGLGSLAFEYWLHSKSSDNPLSIKGSYYQMNDSLGPPISPKKSNAPGPGLTNSIFKRPEDEISEIELTTINTPDIDGNEYDLQIHTSSL
ncbi:hypothetical protein [Legionella longbeachae]|uniref:Putative membrane protein n=1 Tax=Legionella longbeachae serogroup 1 (strain NSW150) TaxID=661367 RepID=D3HTB8_LEGLN|nr:hypothetical protein [Legionella longbeachae]VEE02651.1 Uncharacterised protein [Legionella oakridgensis]ARB91083.1 hypothetical protein A6J40_02295 [Legionella longbeachae]ARM32489.1 hypothetical protein B0B39_02615 [Legionella longbeachae]EEZ94697.1 putative membrane protein [Legionella longbeachae D-4968]QEY51743.1 hypothetical protein FQU71_11100 [Legionella longbeachae]